MRIQILGRVFYISNRVKLLLLIIAVTLIATVGWYIKKQDDLTDITLIPQKSGIEIEEGKKSILPKSSPLVSPNINVYITGCVVNPSVVELPQGSLVRDAIAKAGGLTGKADLEEINLAYKLSDNVMIRVPSIDERGNVQKPWIVDNSSLSGEQGGPSNPGKININRATISDFMTLPGVGESTAKAIIKFRDENGTFKSVEDIMKVSGIKQSRFNSIKDLITV